MKESTQEANEIFKEIFNTISVNLLIHESDILIETSKKIAKMHVDRIIASHQGWATEQDEYLPYYEEIKKEIDNLKPKVIGSSKLTMLRKKWGISGE